MKKFISMVMAAAMVVSLVPATAFAANEATAKVVGDVEITKQQAETSVALDDYNTGANDDTQVQLKLKDVDSKQGKVDTFDITLKFDGAEFEGTGTLTGTVYSANDKDIVTGVTVTGTFADEDDEIDLTITESASYDLQDGDIIYLPLTDLVLTKTKVNHQATVKVTGDFGASDELVFMAIVEKGIDVELEDDIVDVSEEEIIEIEDLVIEPTAGTVFGDVLEAGDTIKLKLSKGFEFVYDAKELATITDEDGKSVDMKKAFYVEDDEIELTLGSNGLIIGAEELTIKGLKVEATTAKEGDVATITVKGTDLDAVKVEVAQVVAEGLTISVDEDEDVPEIWSGVNSENKGLTDDEDHWSLEVTIEETVAGSYDEKDEIELTLPEGVYVTEIKATDENATITPELEGEDGVFADAYREGDHKGFVIEKRIIDETEPNKDAHEITFELELVADPGFVGDVVMEMLVDGESVGEVTIATFKTPMFVEAQANDLIIDYRYTEVPSDIVVKEAEAGLWATGLTVGFGLDHDIEFEDDLVYTVNEESEMEVDGKDDAAYFEVEEESDEEAAEITISNISLYMNRSLAAGAYDLEMTKNSAVEAYNAEKIFAEEHDDNKDKECTSDCVVYIADANDYSAVVKEGFVNIVTAGRDADDASFTTKVVVPVGEAYIIAGEQQVALDVPAYVSAAGYTMLPVRAVAVALGILNNNVLWDQATKTVTILYGQRIITMQVGAKVVYVNGSAIPASASPEVVDGRTFLPMRDLATALGVTDITWDAATKTATLNGNK